MLRSLIALYMSFAFSAYALEGSFINPVTDICRNCVFPITISGVNVTPGNKDQEKHTQKVCLCAGTPPKIGIPITFWEPALLVDVTRHAYKLMGMGGMSVGTENVKNRGSVGFVAKGASRSSFYHVHLYSYPILAIMKMFPDLMGCLENEEVSVPYMSEFDPLWNDDALALIVNPEAGFFSSSLAHVACIPDCAASNVGFPLDQLFWCGGCQGSLYPFTGTISHHVGAIQSSSLLVHRVLAKSHRCGLLKGYDESQFGVEKYSFFIKKSLYKTQIAYPIPQTNGPCHSLGKSNIFWGVGKSYPKEGEDFVYVIWKKKQCCIDVAKKIIQAAGGA